jgi:U3 small nucleolar RNA-associated protein 14
LRAKEEQVDAVLKPLDKNASLPGWGEWGGESSSLNKRHKDKTKKLDLARRIEKSTLMSCRADAHLSNVIINHDVDLVPDRLTLHMIPRPFSNPQEFARSNRQPVGPEWNTPVSFKHGVQPRITTTQGTTIAPLDLSRRPRKSKTKMRKSRME